MSSTRCGYFEYGVPSSEFQRFLLKFSLSIPYPPKQGSSLELTMQPHDEINFSFRSKGHVVTQIRGNKLTSSCLRWPTLPRKIVILGKLTISGKVQNLGTCPSGSKKYKGEAMSS